MTSYADIEGWLQCEVVEGSLKSRYWSKIKPGDVVLDIGAAWGCYTVQAAANSAYVYAFEPRLDAAAKLSMKLIEKHLDERCTIIPFAVTDKSNEVVSLTNEIARSSMLGVSSKGSVNARTTTIDETVSRFKIPKVDWLKMDIEGAEIMALKGGSETIRRFRPNALIECHVGKDPKMAEKVRLMMHNLCPLYQDKEEHNWLDWMGSYHLMFSTLFEAF